MKNRIIRYLEDSKWSGNKLAKVLDITPQTLREEITNIRRNWNREGFLIADKNGYWISYNYNEIEKYEIKVYSRYLGIQKELDNLIRTKWKTEAKKLDIIKKLRKDFLTQEQISYFDSNNIWDTIDIVKEYNEAMEFHKTSGKRQEEFALNDICEMLLRESE